MLEAESAQPSAPPRIDPQTPLADLMVCTTEIIESQAGPCGAGRIVIASDRLVDVAPSCFRPLIETLGR